MRMNSWRTGSWPLKARRFLKLTHSNKRQEMLKAISVQHHKDHILLIELSDGTKGYFDVTPYLDKGIFTQLKDINYLKLVKINFCGICWPAGQDFSADTIAYHTQLLPNQALPE